MFGKIELEQFEELTSMPEDYASAWSGLENIVGAQYKPLLCLGKQVAKGKDFYFLAEQTLMTHPPLRRIVTLIINEFQGEYTLVHDSVEVVLQ